MGCKADFAANSLGFGKKFNAHHVTLAARVQPVTGRDELCRGFLARPRINKTRAQHQLVLQLGQVGMLSAPVNVRKAEIKVAQSAAHSNVGQA